jgi:Styrene monooxygenase A putative substrate binding domain
LAQAEALPANQPASSDLVIVAAGKGAIAQIFERDAVNSRFDRPMRSVTLHYVRGVRLGRDFPDGGVVLVPGVGEIIWYSALTLVRPMLHIELLWCSWRSDRFSD